MKLRTLLEEYKDCLDYDIVLSKHFVIEEKENFEAILDVPVIGIATNDDEKEIRFVVGKDSSDKLGKFRPIDEL